MSDSPAILDRQSSPADAALPTGKGRSLRVWIWIGLALLGGLAYFCLAWAKIHSLPSIIDEGLYLYKGYLFSSGAYVPFQDGGPWTNHMPLSFLIPGWVQAVFGLGLRTGRYYAIALGMLMLLGVWINTRRLGGLGWAAGAVWLIALNPFYLDVYDKAQSQVLIACLLAWVLVFTLGRGRPFWQVVLGAGLAGLTLITRINLLFLLPLVLGYIAWEHGWRTAIWAGVVSLALFAGLQLLYWPEILKLWAKWLPEAVTPFLDPWRESAAVIPAWDPAVSGNSRLASLRIAVLQNQVLLVGLSAILLFWPRRGWDGEEQGVRRVAVFLLLLAVALTALHAWASLGNNYCVFCFTSYLAFFAQLGIYLLAIAAAHWYPRLSSGRKAAGLLVLLLIGILQWSRHFEDLARHLRAVRIPRVAGTQLMPGETTVAGLIKNLTGIPAHVTGLGLNIALLTAALATVAVLLWLAVQWSRRRAVVMPLSALAALMCAWLLVFPLGYSTSTETACPGDVIGSFEAAGAHLARRVPPGSSIYWSASSSPAPLLYIPEARVYPAQLNGDYTYRLAGDPTDLQRFGSWNAEMASAWLAESDFVVMDNLKPGVASAQLDLSEFEELEPSPPLLPCEADSIIRIFRRIQ